MTRTERAAFPRAIIKDRAESKNAMDKRTPKNGAGPHNWGSVDDEVDHETAAEYDEEHELEEEGIPIEKELSPAPVDERSAQVYSEEEIAKARLFRKKAFKKGDLDLGAIARTSSAVSTSPGRTIAHAPDGRRLTDAVEDV